MKLSVSMIVKNESSCLNQCLESLKGADEIVIVDTGSEDDTIEIAKKYTDKVYSGKEYLWRDNFAFSRNQSLEKCTGDWVYIIDADEYLEPNGIEKIREIIKTAKPTDKGFMVRHYDSGTQLFSHNSIRLFRRGPDVKWCAAIHNYLNFHTDNIVDIKHYVGYSKAHEKDPDRAFRILGKHVIETPNAIREKFYLAREYYYKKDWKAAIHYYEWYLESAYFSPEIADAHMMLCYCYAGIGDMAKAREHCLKCIDLNTNHKEALEYMASITGPGNSKRWKAMAETATNEGLLFVRSSPATKIMDNIEVKSIDGLKFYIKDPEEHIQSFWESGKYYEQEMIEYIKQNYKGGSFIDVGACIGNHSLAFSKIADTVYSFEPDLENYYHLRTNIRINNIKNIRAYNIGISDKNEIVPFKHNDENIGMSKIDESGEYKIPTVRLGDFKIEDIKIVKIDVEGYEIKVLESVREELIKYKPDLFIECETTERKGECLAFLKGIDERYEPVKMFNSTPTYLFSIHGAK